MEPSDARTPLDMPISSDPRPPRRQFTTTHPILLLMIIVIGTAAVASALWAFYYRVPPTNNKEVNLNAAGFSTPVSNKLDPSFTDANGDLLADPPTDPSKFIDPDTITFCYVPVEEPEKYKELWKGFCDHLSKATGKPVEYAMFTTTKEQLRALHDGKLQVAGLNTGAVPAAVNLAGFIPVCAIPTGESTALQHTEIIVRADSPIQKPADLKNHELTLTEPTSNSGYKAPLVLLRANFGLEPLNDVLLRYSGSHEASIEGLVNGKYEAAAVASDMLAHAIAHGDIKPNAYRTIYTSESFPTASLGYIYNLKPELAQKVKDAMLSFDWKDTPLAEHFTTDKRTTFVPVNYKDDWSLIRRIDDEMGIQQKIE
jgi:phosphonate transport system substrate-binding protein